MVASRKDEDIVREEFNRWAALGRGEGMIDGHFDVTDQIVDMMDLRPKDCVLDLGCGIGWATRLVSARVPEGVAVGVDIADEMVALARQSAENSTNVFFFNASATSLPFDEGYFNKAISIESLYYYPDIAGALAEVFRVMASGGQVYFMVNLFRENEGSLHWKDKLAVAVSVLGESEYRQLFEAAGFRDVTTARVYDRRPMDYLLKPTSTDTVEQVAKALQAGSLLIVARK
jgi:SAM-dependent methyltransferase